MQHVKVPNISICVVAKNAERTYKRLFDSLREFADRRGDMVLVDTGSTDDTRAIYEAFGFRVFPVGDKFKIEIPKDIAAKINAKSKKLGDPEFMEDGASLFNFSAARNYAASLALNDYIINPDADEALTVFDIDAVEREFKRFSRFRYDFVFSHNADGTPSHEFVTDTRASDRRYWKWAGHVHETNQTINDKATMGYVPPNIFKVEHWQVPSPTRSNYLAGLAYACAIEPGNDRNSHYYARELMYRKYYASAIDEFERHIAMNGWPEERSQSWCYMGDCYLNKGNETKAIACWHKAFDACGTRREPLLRLAGYYYRKDDKQRAAAYAAASLEIQKNAFYGNIRENYRAWPHEILYWAKWWLGDREGSKKHWKLALAFSPDNPKYKKDAEFYDGYLGNNIHGWMTDKELRWLYERSREMGSVIELGAWKGRSTHALCSGCKGQVTSVDHFQGTESEKKTSHVEASRRDIYNQFMVNTAQFNNIRLLKMSCNEAREQLNGETFDMVFIDASHEYQDVKNDIERWRGKAKKLICGHDYNQSWPGVMKAVTEVFGKVETVGSIWYSWQQ